MAGSTPTRADEVVHAALDLGINLFDTADSTASGRPVGGGCSGRPSAAAATRPSSPPSSAPNSAATTGPTGAPGAAAATSRRAVEASLQRLGTDYIDLYQIHSPDPLTPAEETLSALDDLVRAGKVRYLGCSNYAGWQVADAAWVARTRSLTPFVSAQNQYSLLNRASNATWYPACERFGLGVLPYFPLASGLLTGKYRRGQAAPNGTRLHGDRHSRLLHEAPWDTIERLEEYAEARDLGLLDVAIGGLAAQPGVASVIAGATSGDQVRANVAAGGWVPGDDDLAELDAITRP